MSDDIEIDRVEHVATYDDLEDGDPFVAYYIADRGKFYRWIPVPDGSGGYYRASDDL